MSRYLGEGCTTSEWVKTFWTFWLGGDRWVFIHPVLTWLKQAGHARTSKAPPQHCTASVSKSPTYLSAAPHIPHIPHIISHIIPGITSHVPKCPLMYHLSVGPLVGFPTILVCWDIAGHRSSPASCLPFLVLFGIREHLDRTPRRPKAGGNRRWCHFGASKKGHDFPQK